MIQYILECIAFQLVFLIVYDLFLRKETFFQWNRLYLLGTHLLSVFLPWVKIEAFKTALPVEPYVYPEFLWNIQNAPIELSTTETSRIYFSWQEGVFVMGALTAFALFVYKMWQLHRLRKNGKIHNFSEFTQIIVANSNLAFSFFRSIFIGDQVVKDEHDKIIQHELVHIRQRHTWDLLFFELLRIICWFNPLVYVYQNRISELHEFIADAQVTKINKKEQYQLLLSQVFQTQHISFVNHFFRSSLLKKRIVMLQKTKSKKIWQLKYLLLLPVVAGMLFYSSSEAQEKEKSAQEQTMNDATLIKLTKANIENDIVRYGDVGMAMYVFNTEHSYSSPKKIYTKEEFFKQRILYKMYFTQMWQEMAKKGGNMGEISKQHLLTDNIPAPSTAHYNSYVNRKKAFQIMDDNLEVSINAYKQEVVLLKPNDINTSDTYEVRVANVRDLTGIELREFNNKSSEIFEQEGSDFKNLVIRDNQYAFLVFKKSEPIINGLNETREYYTFASSSKGQDSVKLNSQRKDGVVSFGVVDNVPVFPGCETDEDKRGCFHENLRNHIRKNFRYPSEARQREIQGIVNVMFLIDKKGTIANIRTMGMEQLLTDESRRIISLLPAMKPGIHQGEIVSVPFSIPITFKLTTDNGFQKYEEQNPSNDSIIPFAVVEEVPIFPGCENEGDPRACFRAKLQRHISKNFIYPEDAQKKGIQGRVNIMFTINKDGTIVNIRKRGPHKLLEEEALRIINLIPQLKPGEHKGQTVKVPFSIPITFKLQSTTASENVKSNKIRKAAYKGMSVSAKAENNGKGKRVYGKVTDKAKLPLPGVNIAIEGSTKGSISDFDGNFEIEAKKGDVLVFQFIGLPTLKFKITDEKEYQIFVKE